VPVSALITVILDLGVNELQKGELIATRNTTKKAEPVTPHFLDLNQDIVACSQVEECGLKYVI